MDETGLTQEAPVGTPVDYEEWEEGVVDVIASMLSRRWFTSQIKLAIKPVMIKAGRRGSHQEITSLITRAKTKIRESVGISRDEARCEALSFYNDIIRDERVDARVKIAAQERVDRILGIEAKHDGTATVEEQASEIRKALSALEDAYGSVG